ncbi:MAG: MinD/ParA family protein [SAR324 cluster bacterium]|uniref:MinD/ParA family protein n=1 Tax=SAR324 cluster bacterium TaxID=2024889 RepID=A0A7X9FQQ5_9DELT|nr:MinD/ParA family protein [SAR324 cluster bacterium]
MIRIVIVDSSAESRKRIMDELNACFALDPSQLQFFPKLSITPLDPEELRFHRIPDICIVGSKMLIEEIGELTRVRRLFPNTAILVRCNGQFDSLSMVEHLARLGADDILPANLNSLELLRRIILHARSATRTRNGMLILIESGKGGLGVTSIAAALGEAFLNYGKKTLLVDFDFDTQDLCRFLQARPFFNETLGALINQSKPIVQEVVEDCIIPVWPDDDRFFVMPPPVSCEEIFESNNSSLRNLVSVFEVLDSLFDVIIVDTGAARGALRKTLYRIADRLLFVINNDPASMFASVERISDALISISPSAEVNVLHNAPQKHGLPLNLVESEISRATRLDKARIISKCIPFSKNASSWPGSGQTLLSRADASFIRSFRKVIQNLGIFEEAVQPHTDKPNILASLFNKYLKKNKETHQDKKDTVLKEIEYRPKSDSKFAAPFLNGNPDEELRPIPGISDSPSFVNTALDTRSAKELLLRAQVVS